MKIKSKLLLSAFVLSGIFLVSARGPEAKKDPKKETEVRPSLAAGCSPAIRITYLQELKPVVYGGKIELMVERITKFLKVQILMLYTQVDFG